MFPWFCFYYFAFIVFLDVAPGLGGRIRWQTLGCCASVLARLLRHVLLAFDVAFRWLVVLHGGCLDVWCACGGQRRELIMMLLVYYCNSPGGFRAGAAACGVGIES